MADVAIDLGTANTLVQVRGKGIVLNEPSVVVVDRSTGRLVAAGLEAKRMIGRTPDGLAAARPMRDGVIADVDKVEMMLRHYLARVVARGPFRSRPRVIVGVPSGITELERRAVRQAVLAAGAREVFLITEPMAAAIGVGLPVTTPTASMVVNVGGGTTEIGVIALAGLVAENSVRVAGNEMDDAIVSALRKQYSLLIGEETAESIKMQLGSAVPGDGEEEMSATGRDLVTGIPATVRVRSAEVREWIQEPVRVIVAAVRAALEVAPPELAADLVDTGLVLTGGGSLLRGLDRLLASETGLPVHRDPDPMKCVVRGAGMVLEDWARYREVLSA
ncbi:MAG TPA: rod shape-determining protein [Longimicrobiaceae bacterium]|nr:rod shape-determining protein [Longimicrobiaceae bacterium]